MPQSMTGLRSGHSIMPTVIIIIISQILFSCAIQHVVVKMQPLPDLVPGKNPDRIILNLTEDPATSMAVTWRTDSTVTKPFAQILPVQPEPQIPSETALISAKTERYVNAYEDEPPMSTLYHSVIFKGLSPSTKYMYRVGDGHTWSEWFHFKTAGRGTKKFSFIYFGDVQNNIKSVWSRVIRESFATGPDAGFMVYAGDLINRTGRDLEWGEWFHGGGFIHAMIPSAMTPGNHEYTREMTLDPHWRPQFTLPDNGPQGLKETCFFVDYENLRLISLDSDMINESEWAATAQQLWLDSVLTNNPMKWTAVMLHHPFYSTKPNRDNTELRAIFGPILEKHSVDLVLQGHDHGYARGMEKIPSFINPDTTTNTMFVVSVSGAKMYDVSEERWMTRRAVDTQLFQIITIEKDTLNFKAYTATGELYDAFDMVKQSDSKKRLINRIPKVAERVTRKQ